MGVGDSGHLLDRVVPELARGLQGLAQRCDLLLGPGARDLRDTPRLDNAARFVDVAQRRAAVLEHQSGVAGGPGRGLGPTLVSHSHAKHLCVNASQSDRLLARGLGGGGRVGLQAVVHDQRGGGPQRGRDRRERQ